VHVAEERNEVAGEKQQTLDIAPELANSEQDDEQYQAQTLADEALSGASDEFALEDSEKVSTGEDGDDVQDLVDHMRQMVSSGRIDNSAYAGEPNHDDNDDLYLPAVEPDALGAVGSDGE
jgi:hypothetical protein